MKKRIAFLFGAGAVMDWAAPKTLCNREEYTKIPDPTGEITNRPCCLTHLIISIGFKNKAGVRITKCIYDKLKLRNPKANFENIINVIEELATFYSAKDSDSNNIYSLADISPNLEDFSFFKTSEINEYTYSIHFPGDEFYDEQFIPNRIPTHVKYYEKFLRNILQGINAHVSKYSHEYSEGNDKLIFSDYNKEINTKLFQWLNKFINKDFSLRLYSLNYDRLFKIILQDQGVFSFDGFHESSENYYQTTPDLNRIVSDFESNIWYNLHGCATWGISGENPNMLPGYQYYKTPFEQLNNEPVARRYQNGTYVMLTNIITGLQKVHRTSVFPFRQMLSAFDRDCLEAEQLYIIGYSFADEHINDIILNAKKYNGNLEIIIIDPGDIADDFALNFISHWGLPTKGVYENVSPDLIYSEQFKVKIYRKTFSDFLTIPSIRRTKFR